MIRPAALAPATLSLEALGPAGLSEAASAALGLPLEFSLAVLPLDPGALSPGEHARYGELGSPGRRQEWLRGRAALKSLLGRLGMPGDTSLLAFPHARLSLTHSAGLAAAVGCAAPGGLGIDFEGHRPVKAGTERFFLSDAERARLGDAGEAGLLRLWTVKEALFKADPGNRADARILGSYAISGSLSSFAGEARGPGGSAFRYFTLEAAEGFLSVAVLSHPGAPS